MQLLIIFGPPSVGKMTVGKLIEDKTDFRLFHNHAINDAIMHIFGLGTPAEDRLSRITREAVITEAAETGINLIFTYVWNFARDKGKRNIDAYKNAYEVRGGTVSFVELVAPLDIRVARSLRPDRRDNKRYAAVGEEVKAKEGYASFESPQPFFYPKQYKQIDTTDKSPEQIASLILKDLQPVRE